ncbi:hypothetical protein [Spiroplasma endosymbiont of Aspidapion aeneum]|uniref:hypothetical protein n=1 Tax=Spiroplasma endosymbiont of Aspidapion aeneum TaxID=3066276 RepID=UPI00313B805C
MSFYAYLKNNLEGIKNYYKDFQSSSCTERQISFFIKSALGFGKKSFCYTNFSNLLKIRELVFNWDLILSLFPLKRKKAHMTYCKNYWKLKENKAFCISVIDISIEL